MNPQVIRRWTRSSNNRQPPQSNEVDSTPSERSSQFLYYNINNDLLFLFISEVWWGDVIICTHDKKRKAHHSSKKEQVDIRKSCWCYFKISLSCHVSDSIFLGRDFLHPNLVQLSLDSAGTQHSYPQLHVSQHSGSYKTGFHINLQTTLYFLKLISGSLLLPWRRGGKWEFHGCSQHMLRPQVLTSLMCFCWNYDFQGSNTMIKLN